MIVIESKCDENGNEIKIERDLDYDESRLIQEEREFYDRIRLRESIDKEIDELKYDLIQAYCGAQFGTEIIDGVEVDRLEQKKKRFQQLHNQQRMLEGKPAREYIKE
jgi:hypothetical protein